MCAQQRTWDKEDDCNCVREQSGKVMAVVLNSSFTKPPISVVTYEPPPPVATLPVMLRQRIAHHR